MLLKQVDGIPAEQNNSNDSVEIERIEGSQEDDEEEQVE
jgi:hypothetical protein